MEFIISSEKAVGRTGIFHLLPSDDCKCPVDIDCKNAGDTDSIASSHQQSLSGLRVETPNVLAYTRCGRIPHLTADVEQFISGMGSPEWKRIRLSEL